MSDGLLPFEEAQLPLVRLSHIEPEEPERQWLVKDLWLRGGVGLIGGSGKSLKTWCAIDLALSVATSTPALGRFAVHDPGPVLVCAVEETPSNVRFRFEQLSAQRGLDLAAVDVHLLDVPSLQLDQRRDQQRLSRTLEANPAKLLILDPFVRLVAQVDENSAADVSRVLGFLRQLQRAHDMAIMLVHHARKNSVGGAARRNLRGSSDFFAWVDSCLFLERPHGRLRLHVEHRSARGPDPMRITLLETPSLHLCVEPDVQNTGQDLEDRVLAQLAAGEVSTNELRSILGVRKQRLVDLLKHLSNVGVIERGANGWLLTPAASAKE